MAIAAAFLAELAKPAAAIDLWLEVEGLPYAFGLTPRSASWFAGRDVELRRDGILGALLDLPAGVEQEVRPYEATSSIGQLSVSLVDEHTDHVFDLFAHAARTDGWGYLKADLAAPAASSEAPATVDIDMVPPPGAVVGSYLYVGRETLKVVSFPSAEVVRVYRGMFRPPTPTSVRAYQHTAGDVVTTYPRFLRTRRAFFYAAPQGGTDAQKVARWAGTVKGLRMRQGLTGVDLTIESLEGQLSAKCFSGQIRGKLLVGLTAPNGTYDQAEDEPTPFTDRLRLEPSSLSGRDWVDGSRVAVRVGDELISGRLSLANREVVFDAMSTDDARGIWGTPADAHKPGDAVSEVILVTAHNASGTVEDRISRFTKGDNPLDIVLQFLLSIDGDGTNGPFDVLPSGWGLGIDQSRVDVAEIQATRDRWLPAAREVRFIEEPFVARDLAASVLRTHLCYPVTKLDDLLTFRFLGPAMPDTPVRAITGQVILSAPSWISGEGGAPGDEAVVGRVILRCDYDPIDGTWRQTFKGEFVGPGREAQEFYAGDFATPEYECPGQWSGNDPGSAKWGARLCTDAETVAIRHFDLTRERRAKPFPTISFETSYDQLDVEAGDLLLVTTSNVPDVTTGDRDLVGAYCEVLRKTINDATGRVSFTLVHLPPPKQYRLIAPSGVVDGTGALSVIPLVAHDFTDAAGSATDASLFLVGASVEVWSPDLSSMRGRATVTANGGGSLTVDAAITVAAGDVVLLSDFPYQPSALSSVYAHLMDGSTLGTQQLYSTDAGTTWPLQFPFAFDDQESVGILSHAFAP